MGVIIPQLPADISDQVACALREDIGSADVTGELLPADACCHAVLICREEGVLCGQPWAEETYAQLCPEIETIWLVDEGQVVSAGEQCAHFKGRVRPLLAGERTMLNFLQLLSGTATMAHRYVQMIAHTQAQLLDTRKTVPGLRSAQKYAIVCGGGRNHRMGLFDAFLIKENHIIAAGGILQAIRAARAQRPELTLEIEVESLDELATALSGTPDIVMLDNFSLANMKQAVAMADGQVKLEASGGITEKTLVSIAETGVDYISMGTMTKNVRAIDLSLRLKN